MSVETFCPLSSSIASPPLFLLSDVCCLSLSDNCTSISDRLQGLVFRLFGQVKMIKKTCSVFLYINRFHSGLLSVALFLPGISVQSTGLRPFRGSLPSIKHRLSNACSGVLVNTSQPTFRHSEKQCVAFDGRAFFLVRTAGAKLYIYRVLCLKMSASDFSPLSLREKPNASPGFSNDPLKLQVHL